MYLYLNIGFKACAKAWVIRGNGHEVYLASLWLLQYWSTEGKKRCPKNREEKGMWREDSQGSGRLKGLWSMYMVQNIDTFPLCMQKGLSDKKNSGEAHAPPKKRPRPKRIDHYRIETRKGRINKLSKKPIYHDKKKRSNGKNEKIAKDGGGSIKKRRPLVIERGNALKYRGNH
jgi:hypothetical protein